MSNDPPLDEMDALSLFEAMEKARADGIASDQEFARLTRKLFKLPTGRAWFRAACARYNFMGSVFSAEDDMNPGKAAHRDGMRAVLSDILNSLATTRTND